MRRKVTKAELVSYITRLDVRCKKFDEEKFDSIIDDSFSELNAHGNYFFDEDTIDVTAYLADGVSKLSYDIEKDVVYIYDAFVSLDDTTAHLQSDWMVQVDPRTIGRVNLDFTSQTDIYKSYTYHLQNFAEIAPTPTKFIVKYYYVPTSEFTEMYMNRDVHKALRQAISASTYLDLHEEKKHSLHSKKMMQYAEGIITQRPFDFDDEEHLKGFISGC